MKMALACKCVHFIDDLGHVLKCILENDHMYRVWKTFYNKVGNFSFGSSRWYFVFNLSFVHTKSAWWYTCKFWNKKVWFSFIFGH